MVRKWKACDRDSGGGGRMQAARRWPGQSTGRPEVGDGC